MYSEKNVGVENRERHNGNKLVSPPLDIEIPTHMPMIWFVCTLSDLRIFILFLSALTVTLMSHHCVQRRRRHIGIATNINGHKQRNKHLSKFIIFY